MANTSYYKTKVQEIRTSLVHDLYMAVQNSKNMKIKFTETQAPRFYYDGAWREVVQLSIEFMSNKSVSFGWHDERCAGKGVNAYVYSAQISTEMLLQFHELVFGD
jgi:hypothetical protein